MIFTKLRFRNILSTGNQWTEITLNAHKTCLIVGANGSGKSTILDAISFALFNKPFRASFNKPQLVNSINGKGLVVEIEFSVGKKQYKIIRGIKPAIFEVYEDDTLLNQDANVRDYQDHLEKTILKVNHNSFCQVVILGSANYTPFMRLDAKLRREVVEDILDLKIFSLMNSLLLTKKQQNELDISDNQFEKKLLTQRVELIKSHTEEIQSTNNKLIGDKKERINEAESTIVSYNAELGEMTFNLDRLKDSIKNADKQEKLCTELSHIKYKLEAKIANLSKGIEFFEDNESCPTCSQSIEQEFKCDIIVKKKLSMDEAADALVKVNDRLEKVHIKLGEIKEIKNSITSIEIDIHQNRTAINQLNKYIGELKDEIKLVESHNKKIDKKELVNLNEQLSDLNVKYNTLIKRKNLLDMAGIMLKDSGIKSKIIKQYIPTLNQLINKYLSIFDFFVNFTLNERFEEKILSRYRDEFTYGSFSEGEKFRINLSIMFAFRAVAKIRNSINTNLLFLDEVMDSSLDVNGTEYLIGILSKIEAENVFIISHKTDQLIDKFENVLRFTKTKNFSQMEIL